MKREPFPIFRLRFNYRPWHRFIELVKRVVDNPLLATALNQRHRVVNVRLTLRHGFLVCVIHDSVSMNALPVAEVPHHEPCRVDARIVRISGVRAEFFHQRLIPFRVHFPEQAQVDAWEQEEMAAMHDRAGGDQEKLEAELGYEISGDRFEEYVEAAEAAKQSQPAVLDQSRYTLRVSEDVGWSEMLGELERAVQRGSADADDIAGSADWPDPATGVQPREYYGDDAAEWPAWVTERTH